MFVQLPVVNLMWRLNQMWIYFSHISSPEVGSPRLIQRCGISSDISYLSILSSSVWAFCLHVHKIAATLRGIVYTLQTGRKGKGKGGKEGCQINLSLSKHPEFTSRFCLWRIGRNYGSSHLYLQRNLENLVGYVASENKIRSYHSGRL